METRDEKKVGGGWLKGLYLQYQDKQKQTENIYRTTERLIEIADPKIRQAGNYRKKLYGTITEAKDYCSTLIDAIPGPVELNKKQYFDNPIVNALFTSAENLEEVLQTNQDVASLKKDGITGPIIALMTMHKDEKTVYGYQKDGEQVLHDVAQRAVNFTDHRLVGLSQSLSFTKNGIVDRGLDVLAAVAMEEITTLKSKKSELQQKKEYLKATMKILTGKARVFEMFSSPDPGKHEEYRKAEAMLVEVESELEELNKKIGMPDQSLSCLDSVLNQSTDFLKVQKQAMRLNWMNIRIDNRPEEEGNSITLAEFTLNEELKRSAVLVTFPVG